MKLGDLVYIPSRYGSGLIIGWVRTGGPDDTIWEVLEDNGEIDMIFESDMEVVNENWPKYKG